MAVNGIRENDVSRSRSTVAAVTGALRRDPAIMLSRSLVLFAAIGGDHVRRDQHPARCRTLRSGYADARMRATVLCLVIRRKLVKDNPTSAEALRNLGLSLNRLGDVAARAGDLKSAKARYDEALAITRQLAKDNPTSAEAQRDLSVNAIKLGDVAVKAGDLKDANARYEGALAIARKLAEANPTSTEALHDVSGGLQRLGDVAVTAGDLSNAKARFNETLVIARKLAKDNPTSAKALRDLSVSLEKLGEVATLAGDLKEATARFDEAMVIAFDGLNWRNNWRGIWSLEPVTGMGGDASWANPTVARSGVRGVPTAPSSGACDGEHTSCAQGQIDVYTSNEPRDPLRLHHAAEGCSGGNTLL